MGWVLDMARLFGTNGVRGVFGKDMNLELAHNLTLALASHFDKGRILVGHDGRHSSVAMAKVVCSTLCYIGRCCGFAGLVPTPCLEYATKALGYTGGIMITASHNPPQYNGIKPVAANGVEVSRQDELKIEKIYYDKRWSTEQTEWGKVENDDRVIREYADSIISHVNADAIKKNGLKVVLDVGNGAQAKTAPVICKMLEVEAIIINGEIDGDFPGRGPEPTPENLDELSNAVKKNKADFGIAFDGDGDRSILCDERGTILTGDRSALLLIEHLLSSRPNSMIATCVNSGYAIDEMVKKSKSQIIRTKVGSVEVSHAMLELDALVGFEENGGFMYGPHNQVRDGAMTLALTLNLLAASSDTMSKLVNHLPPSFTGKEKIQCEQNKASDMIKVLVKEHPEADTTDGIKISLGQRGWVMVRPKRYRTNSSRLRRGHFRKRGRRYHLGICEKNKIYLC